MGSSGSGKSLLAHGILGILPYNSHMEGEITYRGQPLTPRRAEQLRGKEIVLVPQGVTYLDPLMKVGPQLRGCRRDAQAKAQSRAVLERYGLGAATEELYPFELSGGMARRVLIATAARPDAQTAHCRRAHPRPGRRAAGRILSHFREIADQGAGVLLITHDLELALTIADRVSVFYAGETVEEAAASDFSAGRLRHPYTNALWNAPAIQRVYPHPRHPALAGGGGERLSLRTPVPPPDRGLCRGDPGGDCEWRPGALPVSGRRETAMSLEAKGLSFGYRRKGRVLEQIDLIVEPGERVGLAGPSGRGKTTLCKLLRATRNRTGERSCWTGSP